MTEFKAMLRRLVLPIFFCLGLGGCLYDVTSDQPVFTEADLDPIGPVQWQVLTAMGGNLPQGSSRSVTDEGTVMTTELSDARLVVSEHENGVLLGRMEILRLGESTVRLHMIDPDEPAPLSCVFGSVELDSDLFVVPSIGRCDGDFAHFFFGRTDDPESNGFILLSFETKKLDEIEALAKAHGIDATLNRSEFIVHGEPAPKAFGELMAALYEADLLR